MKHATPKDWSTTTLGDIAQIVMGTSPPGEDIVESEIGLPFIQGNAEFGVRHPKPALWCRSPLRTAEAGDLLVSVRAPVGEMNEADRTLCIGRGLAAVRIGNGAKAFVWHALRQGIHQLRRVAQGSTFTAVNREDIEEIVLPLPPPAEQAKIAAVLGAVDEAVELARGATVQTRTLRRALLHALLTRGLPGRHTKFKPVRLGDIYAERSEHGIAGLPVMSVTNSGLVERSTTDRRVESDLPDEGHALVRKDDIAYNMMRMWQGVSCLADRDCLVSPAYVVCSPKKGIVPQYGAYLLKAPHVVQLLRLHSQGVHEDRLRLYYKHFAPIKVEIPDEDTQRSSVQMIASLDARVAAAESHLAALEQVKSALSAALLTGAVRVPMESRREEVRRG
jgi:type I restriction enzyme S subunit